MNKWNKQSHLILCIIAGLLGSGCAGISAHGTCRVSLGNSLPSSIVSQATSQNAPAIQVPETSYDFGEVTTNHALAHVFEIKNNGTAVLEIEKVLPT